MRKMLNVFPIPSRYENIRLNLNRLIKSLDIVRLYMIYAPHIVSEITVYHHDLFLYYEREELDGNSLMEDRTATFRKQSIAIAVPVVFQERASLPSESPCVALVAFRRFFTDIYHTARCGKVGQLQDIAPPSFHYIKPRFVSRDPSNVRCTPTLAD